MGTPDKFYVSFVVSEFPGSPSDVSEVIGREPDHQWGLGDPVPGHPRARRPSANWELTSPLPQTAGIEDQLRALLPLLEERTDAVRAAARCWWAGINCAAYFYGPKPGMDVLDPGILARIAALGVPLDFDLYYLGPGQDEPEDDEPTPIG